MSSLHLLRFAAVFAVALLGIRSASTQDAAETAGSGPPDEVQRFAPLIGSWSGSGHLQHEAGGAREEWTSTGSARWVFGGHFVREDIRIDVPSMPQPMQVTSVYGWDRENERYVVIEVNNLGVARLGELHFLEDGRLMSSGRSVQNGVPTVERWMTEFVADGEMRFVGHQCAGGGAFFEHVSGTVKRTSAEPSDVERVDAAFAPELVAARQKQLRAVASAIGTYRVRGWWVAEPGAERVEFGGEEAIRARYAGSLLEFVSTGEPVGEEPAFHGIGWWGWDAERACYSVVYANNTGEIGSLEVRHVGDRLVATAAVTMGGVPTCMRGITDLADTGFTRHVSHVLSGVEPPMQVMEMTYERKAP